MESKQKVIEDNEGDQKQIAESAKKDIDQINVYAVNSFINTKPQTAQNARSGISSDLTQPTSVTNNETNQTMGTNCFTSPHLMSEHAARIGRSYRIKSEMSYPSPQNLNSLYASYQGFYKQEYQPSYNGTFKKKVKSIHGWKVKNGQVVSAQVVTREVNNQLGKD